MNYLHLPPPFAMYFDIHPLFASKHKEQTRSKISSQFCSMAPMDSSSVTALNNVRWCYIGVIVPQKRHLRFNWVQAKRFHFSSGLPKWLKQKQAGTALNRVCFFFCSGSYWPTLKLVKALQGTKGMIIPFSLTTGRTATQRHWRVWTICPGTFIWVYLI